MDTTTTIEKKTCCAGDADVATPTAPSPSEQVTVEFPACCKEKHDNQAATINRSAAAAGMPLKRMDMPTSREHHHAQLTPTATEMESKTTLKEYAPLLTIVGIILLATTALALRDWQLGQFSIERWMTSFMAGFFLTFAGFKLINLPGFVQGYSTYDLLAKKLPVYGYIYPFIELALGIAYLTVFQHRATNVATVVVMTFSSLGVLQVLREKRKVKCACLGTAINLPLTTVTLVEDLGMAAMALAMILM